MNYIKRTKMPSITSYKVIEEQLLYVSQGALILDSKMVSEDVDDYYYFQGSVVYTKDYITHFGHRQIPVRLLLDSVNYLENKGVIVQTVNVAKFAFKYTLFDLEHLSVIIDLGIIAKIQGFLFQDNRLIAAAAMDCWQYSIDTGALLWHFSLSGFGTYHKAGSGELPLQVKRVLGVCGRELLLFLSDDSLLSLHTGTGAVCYHTVLQSPYSSELPLDAYYWQLHGGKLVFFRHGWYIEYDVALRSIVYSFDISAKLQGEDLSHNSSYYLLEDGLLYFYNSVPNASGKASMAILDVRGQEIVWKHVDSKHNVFYRGGLQKSDTHLYILDSQDTLHIFERQ